MKKTTIALIMALGIFLVGPAKAEAGYIDGFYTLDNAEILDINDAVDNNDNVSPSVEEFIENEGDVDFNWLFLIKEFESLDPIDIIFDVENSDGVTEYLFLEGVLNSSDVSWTDYHVELGFIDEEAYDAGTGNHFISLQEAGALGLGLDFDTPDKDPAPSSFFITSFDPFEATPIFSTVTHNEDSITWEGGEIPVLDDDFDEEDLAFLFFSIDVPDTDDDFGEWGWEEGYSFALRQYPSIDAIESDGGEPVVPEPVTMALLGSGLLGMAGLRRKKN